MSEQVLQPYLHHKMQHTTANFHLGQKSDSAQQKKYDFFDGDLKGENESICSVYKSLRMMYHSKMIRESRSNSHFHTHPPCMWKYAIL